MIYQIIEAIKLKLQEVFEETITIYSEEREQGLQEPCFFITLLSGQITPLLGTREKREYVMLIQYFPQSKLELRKECYHIAQTLSEELQFIQEEEDIFHGTNIRYEIINNQLQFTIHYNVIVFVPKEKNPMQELLYQKKKG